MTKNKFIKCLKIIAVLGPLVFNLIVCVIGFAGANNVLNIEPITFGTTNDVNILIEDIMINFIEVTAEFSFMPYIGVVMFNDMGTIPILYPLGDFMSNAILGVGLQESLNSFTTLEYSLIGIICMFLYYLMVEIIFFIPEVILLFIRWVKNLIYAFTRKGGFDA